MKKVLQVAAVSLMVVGLIASMAFADTPAEEMPMVHSCGT